MAIIRDAIPSGLFPNDNNWRAGASQYDWRNISIMQVEKSFHQMKGDVGMHNAKNLRNKSLHSKIIVQSCVTPEPE